MNATQPSLLWTIRHLESAASHREAGGGYIGSFLYAPWSQDNSRCCVPVPSLPTLAAAAWSQALTFVVLPVSGPSEVVYPYPPPSRAWFTCHTLLSGIGIARPRKLSGLCSHHSRFLQHVPDHQQCFETICRVDVFMGRLLRLGSWGRISAVRLSFVRSEARDGGLGSRERSESGGPDVVSGVMR